MRPSGRPPLFVQVGLYRSLHNAWNTSHRYGNVSACKWCGCRVNDILSHYLTCLPMIGCMMEVCPSLLPCWCVVLPPPLVPSLLPSALGLGVASRDDLLRIVLWHDFVHHVYCTAKFSSFSLESWKAAFVARRRVWSRHSQTLHLKISTLFI